MPNSCTVCMNNSGKNKDISFFSYPKDQVKRLEWLQVVDREDLIGKFEEAKARRNYKICEQHFEKNCIKFSKYKTVKYLTANAFPTLYLPSNNDDASTSTYQCEEITAINNQNENIPLGVNTANKNAVLLDQTTSSVQVNLTDFTSQTYGHESRSSQTALHLSTDTPRKRQLSSELREAKKAENLDLNSVTKEDFLKLCDKFLSKNMTQLIKWQIDLKLGYSGNRELKEANKKRLYEETVNDVEVTKKLRLEDDDSEFICDLNELKDTSKKHLHEEVANVEITKKLQVEDDDLELICDLNTDILNSRVEVHILETNDGCTHEVVIPHNHVYAPLNTKSSEPAKEYSFELDPFQNEAILCIDNMQSVLVSAHTSAGKTAVAEYAIALALKKRQRVIYTTPIKALSNQKYREFSEEFKDVGLITGDVTIDSSASCLIMTTEILRNMLYRGSEIIREVGWVIFDEIHYMRDKERGVVWEETLILLSDEVRYVFLSATIPNARQFAEWVCRLHSQPCHVVYTEYRPTPLQHYLFPAGGDGIHLVVNEKGQFKEDNFNTAMSVLSNAGDAGKGDQRGRRGGPRDVNQNQTNIFNIVKMVMERKFEPVIIFSFSRKDCESHAIQLAKLDFITIEEKKIVEEIFNNAMEHVLSEEDRKLPQVENALPLLRRGIGIHHGGLLPILKEVIEILFGCGLIKALFATETFAMGLNMPARTVIFTNCQKFDGKEFRFITSGEYIQMSGRAGRRGLDDKGVVILMIDQKVTPAIVKNMVQGKADPINSAFHLTYNMILHLLRVEGINPEYVMERSFFQFQNQSSIPDIIEKVKIKQKEHDSLSVEQENSVASYYNIRLQLDLLNSQLRSFITRPEYLKRFLLPGRLIKVKTEKYEFDWGSVVSYRQKNDKDKIKSEKPLTVESEIIIDVVLHVKESSENDLELNIPCPPNEKGSAEVVSVLNTFIYQISSLRILQSKDLRSADNRKCVLGNIRETKKRFPEGLPLLDPIKDMKIKEPAFKECMDKIKQLEERLQAHPIHTNNNLNSLIAAYERKQAMFEELTLAKVELKKAKSILHMDDLKKRKRVLRRLGYCTPDDVIELKGRIACELSSADELLLTELIFNGVFTSLDPGQSAALVSCFVCDETSSQSSETGEHLRPALRQLQEYARRIAKVSIESRLDLDEDDYVSKFKCTLMDVVLAWAKGASFLEICKMTDVFEGSIIRCMRRLEETLRQLCQAAKNIGNTDLENKFSEAMKLLKRDIVFAASLYSLEQKII